MHHQSISNIPYILTAHENRWDIYLLNDIDLENEAIDFGNISKFEFIGNGHKVSNVVINKEILYAQDVSVDHLNKESHSVYVSLVGDVKNSKVIDVTFENVLFKISVTPARAKTIYIAGLTTSIVDSEISNVSINATYELVKLPEGFNVETNLIVSQNEFIISKTNSTTNNISISIEKENK